jgi:hypothetical protein
MSRFIAKLVQAFRNTAAYLNSDDRADLAAS